MGVAVLGEFEQLVMLAVMCRGESAYGIPVRDEIVRRARREVALGGIYKTLSRLEHKGFVASTIGAPSARRGGRRTRCYTVTAAGQRALRTALGSIQRMAAGASLVPESR
jgi:PadR family transcriptional regulator, regulatory protein PadR